MLRLPRSLRVFVSTRPVNVQASVDRLVRFVREDFGADPFTDNLYCFFNHRRDRVQLLVWDRNGFWILCKRLERGQFEALDTCAPQIEISREQLVMLLSGISTKTGRFRPHFARDVRIEKRDGEHERRRVAR